MNVTWDAVIALVASLLMAFLPLPRRAEGLRLGFFSAALAFLVADALRQRSRSDEPTDELEAPIAIAVDAPEEKTAKAIPIQADLPPVTEDERIDGMDLLTGFSILRYLRRTGAVSDSEFEAKKQDLLRRA